MGVGGATCSVLAEAGVFWRMWVVVLTPLILLPLILVYPDSEVQCAYIVLIISVFWISEALPMGVTGLLPVILFPIMGLMPMSVIAGCYMRNAQLLLIGSLMMAVAIERCNLHKRVAIKVLLMVGTSPRRLLLGVMIATGVLSMFVANIPTTAMMIPVVEVIIEELKQERVITARAAPETANRHNNHNNGDSRNEASKEQEVQSTFCGEINIAMEEIHETSQRSSYVVKTDTSPPRGTQNEEEAAESDYDATSTASNKSTREYDPVAKMLSIAVCYSGSIGGSATLMGSGINMVAFEKWESHYQGRGKASPVSYATWIPAALPGAVITLIITWIWIQICFLRGRCWGGPRGHGNDQTTRRMLQKQYAQLGPISFAEKSNIVFFVILTLLWFFRAPGFMPGYGELFPSGYVTDAVPAVLVAVLLFVFPNERPKMLCWKEPGEKARRVSGLLEWSTTYPHLAWTAFFIVGAGFAIADGCQASGLSAWLGRHLESLAGLDHRLVAFIASLLVGALTQVMSNLATVSLTVPILLTLSDSIGAHPLQLTMPAAFICSSAFMLPSATATNAMVFEAGHLTTLDMVLCGFVTNITFILVTTLGAETWMPALFNFDTLPWDDASGGNSTTMTSSIS